MRAQRILCPVDFSECSKLALQAAIQLARDSGGALHLIFVVTPTVLATGDMPYYAAELLATLKEGGERALAEWRAQAITGGARTVETVCVIGVPWNEIVTYARTHECDLLVMGTHGRSGLQHVLIGSVAEKVLRHAPCSVLVVRKP